MSVDSQTIRAERFTEIGKIVQQDAGILLQRWARRAVEEQPKARRVHHDVLLDQLSNFLWALGRSLAESSHTDTSPLHVPALEHGEQRWETGWSLPEVIRDYQILRIVILEYLEETLERPLRYREVIGVGLALDEAIAASVGMYVSNRDENIRAMERDRLLRQQEAEKALNKLEQIFEHACWGVALFEPTSDCLLKANPAFADMHGHTREEIPGKRLSDLLVPEFHAELSKHFEKTDRDGHEVFESIHRRKDGTQFPVLTHMIVIRDSAGQPLYRAANFQDISERKSMEESLRLQAEVLKKVDRNKNEFLAMLAHELRNPLAPILNSVELLRLAQPSHPAVVQARDVIERQANQMVRLVDDLLDLTRISQGRIELRKERLELAKIAAQAVQTSESMIQAGGHQLHVTLPSEPVWFEADRARIVQILVNLLNNAAKYTEPGGQIWLSGEVRDDNLVLRVRDTGVGIPEAMRVRIFDLFTQVDASLHRSQGGLGIGLTLVRLLVEMHGGTVSVDSAGEGQGSVFEVVLPTGPRREPTACAASQDLARSPSRHILIVEDNADGRNTLESLLTLWGHRVEVAETGEEGIQKALKSPPEFALVDLGLPGLDGFGVAERMREHFGESIFLVALTGFGQAEDRKRTSEVGFNAHLVKPVNPQEISQLLLEGLLPAS